MDSGEEYWLPQTASIEAETAHQHWKWLGRIGKTTHWLNFHIFAGLAAPIIITFHSSFKMNGIAGLAYWIMMAAVISGVVGRYFYAKIPRNLSAAEMSLKEMEELSRQ